MSENIETQIKDLEAQVAAAEAAAPSEVNNETTSAETSAPADSAQVDDDMVRRMVEQRVQEELASIKSKLDDAYSQRDEAVKLKVKLEDEKRQAEIKRMEDEGKHKEVAELRMAELQAKLDTLTKENTRLSRDHAVTDAVRDLPFRSSIAGDMAKDRILSELVQDENGQWRHKSGVSIKEFVDHYAKDEDNAFLFKAKTNSGAGSQAFAATTDNAAPTKPITEMTSEELLQHFSQQAPQNPYGNF